MTVASPVLASEFIEGDRKNTFDKNGTENQFATSGNQMPENSKILSIPAVATTSESAVETADRQTQSAVADLGIKEAEKVDRESLANITSVSELSDVKPTDWAFSALKSLVERYGLIAGYPDGTFRGNRALTRYEFAAALNAALDRLNQQIAANTANFISREDLEILRRLQAEFEGELAGLRGRVENLSQRLDAVQQFSTTTTLDGEALVGVIGVEGNEKADGKGDDVDSNLTFGYRVRLNFDTSFTGKDRLRTRLQANNIPKVSDAAETDMANLSFQGESDNQFELSRLEYRFPINREAVVYVEAVGGSLNDYTDTLNPFLSGSSRGTVSRFGQRNPIYRHGEGSGIGISYAVSKSVSLDVGFIADKVNDPEIGFGKAAYGAIAQLTLRPTNNIGVGLTYVRSYNSLDTGTGSDRANDPFDGESDAIAANSFGIQSTVKISRQLTAGGWVGYTRAQALDLRDRPEASMFNWAVTLAFPDLGSEDSVGGIVIGQQPKVINSDFIEDDREYIDPDTSLHLEAFYRRQFTDNLAVTLGLLAITNPEHNSNTDPIYIGTLRTTFSF
ncbi:iron uptake porin [Microcoleus sp. herbarium19]|uniref:iron uptake porin n=1 Tax=unclassified Microcoleus TaxID=2642155 RepID=UPI002FD01E2C